MKNVTVVRGAILSVVLVAFGCSSATTTSTPATQPATGTEQGVASWYGQEFAGRTTANGEIFDPMLFTAAHRTLPFGTIVDVRNPKTNQSVRVRINDRGPYIGNRTIDLSYAAAQQISLIEPGTGDIVMSVVKVGKGDREPPAPFSVSIGNETPAPAQIAAAPPASVTPMPTPAPESITPAPVTVDHVEVVETRRQVSPSGKSVETVPVAPAPRTQPAPTPAPATPTASAPPAASVPPPAASRPAPAPAPPNHHSDLDAEPRPAANGRYAVQVGAFSQEVNAKALQDRLTRVGQQSHVDHGSLYYVRIGPFATREQAVQVRAKLEASGISALVVTP